MNEVRPSSSNRAIYMGLDLHRKSWHLTIGTQQQELRKMSLPPQWSVLQKARETVTTIKATFVLFEAYLRRGSFSEKFSRGDG